MQTTQCRTRNETNSKDRKMAIKVRYWAGTTQKEKTIENYAEAMELIDREHRNSYSPRFETEDGETLVDTGEFLVTEAEAVKPNPTVYA